MKIGLVSDTHLPNIGHALPDQLLSAFDGVDLILHAGDVYSPECLDWLERIAPILAVEVPPARRWATPGSPNDGWSSLRDTASGWCTT